MHTCAESSIETDEERAGALSPHAEVLLGYLYTSGGMTCIGERSGIFYIIPSPTFNWDGRLDLPRVRHPECVPELVIAGYLSFETRGVSNPNHEYSGAAEGSINHVYLLTEAGKQVAAKLAVP